MKIALSINEPDTYARVLEGAARRNGEYYDVFPGAEGVGFHPRMDHAGRPDGWAYTASAGNKLVVPKRESAYYEGSRHALIDHHGVMRVLGLLLKAELVDFKYEQTSRSDLQPFETTTPTFRSQSIFAADAEGLRAYDRLIQAGDIGASGDIGAFFAGINKGAGSVDLDVLREMQRKEWTDALAFVGLAVSNPNLIADLDAASCPAWQYHPERDNRKAEVKQSTGPGM